MSLRVQVKRPELLIPRGEINCKVVQRRRPIRVSLRAKVECSGFSVEDNGLNKVLHRPYLLEQSGETICKS